MAITSGNDQDVPRTPERPGSCRRRLRDGSRLASGRPTRHSDQVALAEYYGISQATVTRVLRSLPAEGLIRTVPRWGTFRA